MALEAWPLFLSLSPEVGWRRTTQGAADQQGRHPQRRWLQWRGCCVAKPCCCRGLETAEWKSLSSGEGLQAAEPSDGPGKKQPLCLSSTWTLWRWRQEVQPPQPWQQPPPLCPPSSAVQLPTRPVVSLSSELQRDGAEPQAPPPPAPAEPKVLPHSQLPAPWLEPPCPSFSSRVLTTS